MPLKVRVKPDWQVLARQTPAEQVLLEAPFTAQILSRAPLQGGVSKSRST